MLDASGGPASPRPYHRGVPPNLLLAFLLAGILALIPVWRLRAADWPGGWLQTAWLVGFLALVVTLMSPPIGRFLSPVLIVLFVLPYALGTDRLRRLARRPERRGNGVIIDVTPRPRDGAAGGVDGPAPNP
jgi:hypothetical protein